MRRKNKVQEPRKAELTVEQMQAAIPRLRKRVEELMAIDVETIQERGEIRFQALLHRIDDTLVETFGSDTIEYDRYRVWMFDTPSIISGHPTPIQEVRIEYKRGIDGAIAKLQTVIDMFEEKLDAEPESPVSRTRRAFGELDLHPEIAHAVTKLFQDGHYANAVEDACKVLDLMVKMRSGKHNLSGTELMQVAFSPKAPLLAFNDLNSETDHSEQQGMMYLYAGAMLALRNPRAHELIEDDPVQALEHIAFLSFLCKSLKRATRT